MDTSPTLNQELIETTENESPSPEPSICLATGQTLAEGTNVVHCGKLIMRIRDFSEIPDWVMAGG